MQQEAGVPAPLHAARALETPLLPARLRHPPLAQGAGPGTRPRRQGAGARPAACSPFARRRLWVPLVRSRLAAQSHLSLLKRNDQFTLEG